MELLIVLSASSRFAHKTCSLNYAPSSPSRAKRFAGRSSPSSGCSKGELLSPEELPRRACDKSISAANLAGKAKRELECAHQLRSWPLSRHIGPRKRCAERATCSAGGGGGVVVVIVGEPHVGHDGALKTAGSPSKPAEPPAQEGPESGVECAFGLARLVCLACARRSVRQLEPPRRRAERRKSSRSKRLASKFKPPAEWRGKSSSGGGQTSRRHRSPASAELATSCAAGQEQAATCLAARAPPRSERAQRAKLSPTLLAVNY